MSLARREEEPIIPNSGPKLEEIGDKERRIAAETRQQRQEVLEKFEETTGYGERAREALANKAGILKSTIIGLLQAEANAGPRKREEVARTRLERDEEKDEEGNVIKKAQFAEDLVPTNIDEKFHEADELASQERKVRNEQIIQNLENLPEEASLDDIIQTAGYESPLDLLQIMGRLLEQKNEQQGRGREGISEEDLNNLDETLLVGAIKAALASARRQSETQTETQTE